MNSYKECVINACKCRKGSHPLARAFGLNAVDSPAASPRLEITKLIRAYYPEIQGFSITQGASSGTAGEFAYNLAFHGDIPER